MTPEISHLKTPRTFYFREGTAAYRHGIIGIEYAPEARLPMAHHFSWVGQWLNGQHHCSPITTLLVDDQKLHEWMAPHYPKFSRVAENGWATPDYHSRPFNDLFSTLKNAYMALPSIEDPFILNIFQHGIDPHMVDNNEAAIAQDQRGKSSVKPQHGYCSRIAMRLGQPETLLGLLHHLELPTHEPIIDYLDMDAAAHILRPNYAERLEAERESSAKRKR